MENVFNKGFGDRILNAILKRSYYHKDVQIRGGYVPINPVVGEIAVEIGVKPEVIWAWISESIEPSWGELLSFANTVECIPSWLAVGHKYSFDKHNQEIDKYDVGEWFTVTDMLLFELAGFPRSADEMDNFLAHMAREVAIKLHCTPRFRFTASGERLHNINNFPGAVIDQIIRHYRTVEEQGNK